MSDATDAVAEAKIQNRRLAAKYLVRAEELERELVKLRKDREDAAADAELSQALDAKIAATTTEFLAAKHDYEAALAELGELDRLGAKAKTLEAQAIAASVTGDPVIRSAEQIALDNVREHAKNLDAQVRLDEELGGKPAAAPPPKLSREDADAAALREFEALRNRKTAPPAPEGEPESAPPSGQPKKTL
jgi:hypothetical protein